MKILIKKSEQATYWSNYLKIIGYSNHYDDIRLFNKKDAVKFIKEETRAMKKSLKQLKLIEKKIERLNQ